MVNSLLRAQIGVELCHCQGCRAVRRVAYAGSNDVGEGGGVGRVGRTRGATRPSHVSARRHVSLRRVRKRFIEPTYLTCDVSRRVAPSAVSRLTSHPGAHHSVTPEAISAS